jgi:hypothetical protein
VERLEDRCLLSADLVVPHWNELLLQSLASQPPLVPMARNMALVHVAMFDAVNSIDRSYEPYYTSVPAPSGASLQAAAAEAAFETLVALYPSRQTVFQNALDQDLAGLPAVASQQGIAVGHAVAVQILALRQNDGSSTFVAYTPPNNDPGQWQPTAPNFPAAANAHVPLITPFAVQSSSQFRPPPPPALNSQRYATDFNEVKAIGGVTSLTRTADQTLVAQLWQAARTNHQVWNRVAQDVAVRRGNSLVQNARLFALLNMALNDGLETSFESKYYYTLWRPVTAIRRADEDGNPRTQADPTWLPLHSTTPPANPANTPPYPSYASNASAIGGACATVLGDFYGDDDIHFQIHWDPYGFSGVTRSYTGFWAAADEMANSRIYGGIHFRFDCVAGQRLGLNVANYVVDNFLLPREDDQGNQGNQLRAAAAAPAPASESLRSDQVQPLLVEALTRWQTAGVNTSGLRGIDVRIVDLSGLTLGQAASSAILLDTNAAGWGWFVDPTPGDDAEFTTAGDQGEQGRMDLLTVLEHEIGHRLGREHEAAGVMQETLDAGTRRTVGPSLSQDTGWGEAAQALFAWNADTPWIDHGFGGQNGKRR